VGSEKSNIDIAILKQAQIFKRFSEDQLQQIAIYFEEILFKKGEEIIRLDEPGDCMYMVACGKVHVQRKQNHELVFSFTFEPGDIFGETALIENVKRTATVVAASDACCYKLTQTAYLQLSQQYPQMGVFLLQEVSKRARLSAEKYTSELQRRNKELESLYVELQKAHKELQGIDQVKTAFIHLVTHELLTPVNVFQTSLAMLEQKAKQTDMERYVAMINKQSQRLNKQIRQIVELTEEESYDLQKVPFEHITLEHALNDTVSLFAPLYNERSLEFSHQFTNLPDQFYCVPVRFRQILDEILYNALRFTDDGGCVNLSVWREADPPALLVECKDNGIGIAESSFHDIFQPFFEGVPIEHHTSGETEFMTSGMGVGLSIVLANIRYHRGKIWLQSELGTGTTFRLAFPIEEDQSIDGIHQDGWIEIL
jgi:signal transduction histidine kinase